VRQRFLASFKSKLKNWHKFGIKKFGTGRGKMGLYGQNGTLRAKWDFGRVYLILLQNKAKICPIIVTMPTEYAH
jgi:hypothetical protein